MANNIADAIATAAERISSILGPRAMRALARFNEYVTNPIQRPYLPYIAVMEHVGRKSGTSYRTPVNYGDPSDWVGKVQAGEAG